MLTRNHVMPYIGQRIVVQTKDGVIHHGFLHHVCEKGIYLRPVRGGVQPMAGESAVGEDFDVLQNLPQKTSDTEQVWFPFFFLPFFALAAFWPWWWW